MVAGHLTLKNGRYYAVLNYRNAGGQRKTKWIALGLPEKGNKRKAEAELARLRAEFEPPKEVGDLSSDIVVRSHDETGQLMAALRDMNTALVGIVLSAIAAQIAISRYLRV